MECIDKYAPRNKEKPMSTNLSKQKREDLLSKIEEIRNHIKTKLYDENAGKLFGYLNELAAQINGQKYGLVFEEHRESIDDMLEENLPVLTEEKKLFVDGGGELNFLLEGDNLASLQLLEKTHKGKIDVIYIDPPYNTGKEDFIYDDNYIEKDDSFKHSKWLSFMKKRLKMAHSLLKDNGIIFISIDDNECAPLKLLCDEIFGEDNRLSLHHIQVRYENKSLNEKKAFQEVCEYVLIYEKKMGCFDANRPSENYSLDSFCFEIKETGKPKKCTIAGKTVEIFQKNQWEISKVESGLDKLKETWITGSIYSGTGHGTTYQKIVEPRLEEDGYQSLYKIYGLGEDGLGYRYFTNPAKQGATKGKMFTGVPLSKKKEIENGNAIKYKTISNLYDFSPDFGNIRHEGGVPFGSGKKPVKMLKQFINYHKEKDITVLDFFAGSGSTGHATLALNNEDGGKRKFILCTNNENNICRDITYQRIKNVITKDGLPGSLKYFKVDFVPVAEKEYYEYADKLLLHVRELVELENAVDFKRDKSVAIVLTEEELAEFTNKIEETDQTMTKILYLGHDVLLSKEQKSLFKKRGVKVKIIPQYYYPELNG